jgi:hypothetical protein
MTQTAKYLVLVNLVLSVVFVAWAVGLLTNEVPWHTPPAGDGPKVEGLIAELQGQIKQLDTARKQADVDWGDAYVQVQATEKQRTDAQNYYTALLNSVRFGNVADIKPPVQQLAFSGPNVDITKRNGRPPITIGDADALSLAGYHEKIQQTIKEIDAAQAAIKKLIAETEALTKQINGVPPGDPNAPTLAEKGLRVQIREQQDLVHSLELEQQYLRSPLTYFLLQRDQLRQRQAALLARLDELKATATVRGD